MLYVIGDVHGKIAEYEKILQDIHKIDEDAITIQVGDMAVGFQGIVPPNLGKRDFWLYGNHDCPTLCKECVGNLGDFGIQEFANHKIFWLSGALSIDRHLRTIGVHYWEDEEVSNQKLLEAISLYEKTKPDIVISHDGPQHVIENWFGNYPATRTRQALSAMWQINHVPKKWIFGHHHKRRHENFSGCNFSCLGELDVMAID